MRKTLFMISASIMLAACSGGQDISAVADADSTQVHRVEPLSWWTGMKTSLQLMVQGDRISEYELSVEGGKEFPSPRFTKLTARTSCSRTLT